MDSLSMVLPDIASLSTIYSAGKTQESVGVAVLSQALDVQESQGNALTKMMELSVQPGIGSNFDVSV